MEQQRRRRPHVAGIALGAVLVLGGIALLVAQIYGVDIRFDLARYGWPMFIILPGVLLLLIGLATSDAPGIGLAVAGSVVTTVGLLLSYQLANDHWASWAYAWALVAPGSVGAGMLLWGVLHLNGRVARSGLGGLAVGVVLFLILFGFFEGLLRIGDERGLAPLGRTALPVALIVGGALIIVARLWPRRPRHEPPQTWMGARPIADQGPIVSQRPPTTVSEQPSPAPPAVEGTAEETAADRPADESADRGDGWRAGA